MSSIYYLHKFDQRFNNEKSSFFLKNKSLCRNVFNLENTRSSLYFVLATSLNAIAHYFTRSLIDHAANSYNSYKTLSECKNYNDLTLDCNLVSPFRETRQPYFISDFNLMAISFFTYKVMESFACEFMKNNKNEDHIFLNYQLLQKKVHTMFCLYSLFASFMHSENVCKVQSFLINYGSALLLKKCLDRELHLNMLGLNGGLLKHLKCKDYYAVKAALNSNSRSIGYLPTHFSKHKELVKLALLQDSDSQWDDYMYLDDTLNYKLLDYIDESLLNDINFMSTIINYNSRCLKKSFLRNNSEFMLASIQKNEKCAFFLSDSLKKNISYIKKVVQKNGMALFFLPDYQNQKCIVEAAVKQNGIIFFSTGLDFRFKNNILLFAISDAYGGKSLDQFNYYYDFLLDELHNNIIKGLKHFINEQLSLHNVRFCKNLHNDFYFNSDTMGHIASFLYPEDSSFYRYNLNHLQSVRKKLKDI